MSFWNPPPGAVPHNYQFAAPWTQLKKPPVSDNPISKVKAHPVKATVQGIQQVKSGESIPGSVLSGGLGGALLGGLAGAGGNLLSQAISHYRPMVDLMGGTANIPAVGSDLAKATYDLYPSFKPDWSQSVPWAAGGAALLAPLSGIMSGYDAYSANNAKKRRELERAEDMQRMLQQLQSDRVSPSKQASDTPSVTSALRQMADRAIVGNNNNGYVMQADRRSVHNPTHPATAYQANVRSAQEYARQQAGNEALARAAVESRYQDEFFSEFDRAGRSVPAGAEGRLALMKELDAYISKRIRETEQSAAASRLTYEKSRNAEVGTNRQGPKNFDSHVSRERSTDLSIKGLPSPHDLRREAPPRTDIPKAQAPKAQAPKAQAPKAPAVPNEFTSTLALGGAGLGGLAGNLAHRYYRKDEEDSDLFGSTLATLGGAGVGGSLGYALGHPAVQAQLSKLMSSPGKSVVASDSAIQEINHAEPESIFKSLGRWAAGGGFTTGDREVNPDLPLRAESRPTPKFSPTRKPRQPTDLLLSTRTAVPTAAGASAGGLSGYLLGKVLYGDDDAGSGSAALALGGAGLGGGLAYALGTPHGRKMVSRAKLLAELGWFVATNKRLRDAAFSVFKRRQ